MADANLPRVDDPAAIDDALAPATAGVAAQLVANHRRFLAFLEPRVESRAVAEELLQAAFVRSLEKAGELRDGERAVAWFFRLLRNAVVDHYRRRAAYDRALERSAAEAPQLAPPPDDEAMQAQICQCVSALLPALQPSYAELLERVELRGQSVAAAAADLGITAGNAAVRLHRARLALKRQLEKSCGTCATHGCLDCTCGARNATPCE
jgi:RNA polymerase sigma factor (sigma-70 family)